MWVNKIMQRRFSTTAALAMLFVHAVSQAQTVHHWGFDRNSDRENWTIPADALGVVMGGSLWLTLPPKERDSAEMGRVVHQIFGILGDRGSRADSLAVVSPSGLKVQAPVGDRQIQIRMRVLNLSPVTDLFITWRSPAQGWGDLDAFYKIPANSKRCSLKSDIKVWQEITCYIDKSRRNSIDQIGIVITQRIRGDLWIDSIEVASGLPEPKRPIPDVASARVVPKITLPEITQSGFSEAFQAVAATLIIEVPVNGFTHPVTSPGGYYSRGGWWEDDASLTLAAAKWANQAFAENVMRGFGAVQALNPDGRIDLWGNSAVRGQVADAASFPQFFEAAYDVARRTSDVTLRVEIYRTLQRYLDWWLSSVKRDSRTGLISAVFEETFGEEGNLPSNFDIPAAAGLSPQTLAPVDLNVLVAVGAKRTAELATALGRVEESRRYEQTFQDLSTAINQFLWDDKDGAYYNYDLREQRVRRRLLVTTFDPLRLQIAPAGRRERLFGRLLDPAQFNWGTIPLTSMARTDPQYVEAKGDYDGRAWLGNVWTVRNLPIIAGLEESGRPDLAAELNWATVKAFHANYWEYLIPSSGEGQGAKNYAWTASQYIQAIVEHLFGVDFDQIRHRVTITPHVPQKLYGKELTLEDLILPTGADTRLSVRITQRSPALATIHVEIGGEMPQGKLIVSLPSSGKKYQVTMQRSFTANFP
jgi:hypothetical protein